MNNPPQEGDGDGFGAVRNVEFLQDMEDVDLDGRLGPAQCGRDLLVAEPPGHVGENNEFPAGQLDPGREGRRRPNARALSRRGEPGLAGLSLISGLVVPLGLFGGFVLPVGIAGIWLTVVVGWAWLTCVSLSLRGTVVRG